MPTAVVIDGAYFLRRFRSSFPDFDANDIEDIKFGLCYLACWHLRIRLAVDPLANSVGFKPEESSHLYRIFFYDCPPLTKKVHTPVSKRAIDLSKTETAKFRIALHKRLQTVRKVTLRLGRLSDDFVWRPKGSAMKSWLAAQFETTPSDEDFELDVIQKGVDMRLGLDVASMAFKRQVDQIVLVAADGDFVPAVKLARREGIDVVLDPMGGSAAPDLLAHVDGVRDCRLEGSRKDLVK